MGMRETAMEATDRLVQFIADTNYNTLPEEVVSAAKIGIMDGVANMLAGATQPLAAVISTCAAARRSAAMQYRGA